MGIQMKKHKQLEQSILGDVLWLSLMSQLFNQLKDNHDCRYGLVDKLRDKLEYILLSNVLRIFKNDLYNKFRLIVF